MEVLQNLQKFRVQVLKPYKTHKSSGYCGMGVQNSQKFQAGIKMLYPYREYRGTDVKTLTEVPGTGMNVIELAEVSGTCMNLLRNTRKFRVLWHGRTELTDVPGRYKMLCPYPRYARAYRTYRKNFRIRV